MATHMTNINDRIYFDKNFDEVKAIFEKDNRKMYFDTFDYGFTVKRKIIVDVNPNSDCCYVFVFFDDKKLYYKEFVEKRCYKQIFKGRKA